MKTINVYYIPFANDLAWMIFLRNNFLNMPLQEKELEQPGPNFPFLRRALWLCVCNCSHKTHTSADDISDL